MSCAVTLFLAPLAVVASARTVGILYETWHTFAAQSMQEVLSRNGTGLTAELVLRAGGGLSFNDVYAPYGLNSDIYGAQPELGFYCLWDARPGDPPPSPARSNCPNIESTLKKHAALLSDAGVDYVAIDWTNWPTVGPPASATDIQVLRPTENLFDTWSALRAQGVMTPAVAVWPCSPAGGDTWRWALTHIYLNASRLPLVWRDPVDGRPVMFLPFAGANCYDAGVAAQIEAAGIKVVPMWALFDKTAASEGVWGFFSPCTDATKQFTYTTSQIGVGPCNQFPATNGTNGSISELTASGGYQYSQGALPFASPGKLRGLTLVRGFEAILSAPPPFVFQ